MGLVIGSTAMRHYFPDFPREPKDLDIAVFSKEGLSSNTSVEYLLNPILFDYQQDGYLRPELMLSLKISHMFWENNWEKHMFDIQYLLKRGVRYNINIILKLKEYWAEVLPKIRRSNLDSNKEDFFTNAVNEDTEEHDYLHTLINPKPIYTRLLKEGSEVDLDDNKWFLLSFEEKLEVVFEEVVVMLIERYKNTDPVVAYKRQLKDCIVKHFPFYISLFSIENYVVLERYKIREVIKFHNELAV